MRVSLFVTCLIDTLFPAAGRATVELLERLGHTVEFNDEQTCCGQLFTTSGYADLALPLARRFSEVFGDAEAIVTPSASCAAMVRHHYRQLAREADDPRFGEEAERLATRVFELSAFLVEVLGVEDVGASFQHRVAYHPSCHGLRVLRLGDAPERLLRGVRGLELVDLEDAESCCGFGGTFSIKNADVSTAMMTDKLSRIINSGAEICTATDSSCLMHIEGGLRRTRAGVRTMHLAEILASAD